MGSTAVPSAIGKEDIDILVRVPHARFDTTRAALDGVFKRDEQQLSSEVYQGYKISTEPDIAIQLTVEGGEHDRFHQFLQALRSDPNLLAEYNGLKQMWDGKPMDDYRRAKDEFIENVLKKYELKAKN